jgi:cold shock CspA family protein
MPKASEQRQTGRVVAMNWERGFGWVTGPHGQDVFIGAAELRRCGIDSIDKGDWLEYAVRDKGKGRQEAVDVALTVPSSAADRRPELLSKRAPA